MNINKSEYIILRQLAARGTALGFTERERKAMEFLQDMGLVDYHFSETVKGYVAEMRNFTFNGARHGQDRV